MMLDTNGNNQMIVAIINLYFTVSETNPEQLDDLANKLVQLITQVFSNELKSTNALNLPYKDITDIVFHNNKTLLSDSISNFKENVKRAISENYQNDGSNMHHNTQKKYVNRFMHIHDKLVEHTLLAQAQREFIQKSIKEAQEIANNAQEIASKAGETAKKAEETYKSMFANYVTILGIFTAIIVTIFGGLNVINTVTKGFGESTLVVFQLTSLLILCEILLLYFLAKLIAWITNSQTVKLEILFYGIVIVCCLCIILIQLFK